MNLLTSLVSYILILVNIPSLCLAAPLPREVEVSQHLHDSLSGGSLHSRDIAYITRDECSSRRSSIKFCAMGHYLCQSISTNIEEAGLKKWEAIDDPEKEKECPKQGWRGNSDIIKIETKSKN